MLLVNRRWFLTTWNYPAHRISSLHHNLEPIILHGFLPFLFLSSNKVRYSLNSFIHYYIFIKVYWANRVFNHSNGKFWKLLFQINACTFCILSFQTTLTSWLYCTAGLHKLCQPASLAVRWENGERMRKWRGNGERMRKLRENEEIERKWRQNEEMER